MRSEERWPFLYVDIIPFSFRYSIKKLCCHRCILIRLQTLCHSTKIFIYHRGRRIQSQHLPVSLGQRTSLLSLSCRFNTSVTPFIIHPWHISFPVVKLGQIWCQISLTPLFSSHLFTAYEEKKKFCTASTSPVIKKCLKFSQFQFFFAFFFKNNRVDKLQASSLWKKTKHLNYNGRKVEPSGWFSLFTRLFRPLNKPIDALYQLLHTVAIIQRTIQMLSS